MRKMLFIAALALSTASANADTLGPFDLEFSTPNVSEPQPPLSIKLFTDGSVGTDGFVGYGNSDFFILDYHPYGLGPNSGNVAFFYNSALETGHGTAYFQINADPKSISGQFNFNVDHGIGSISGSVTTSILADNFMGMDYPGSSSTQKLSDYNLNVSFTDPGGSSVLVSDTVTGSVPEASTWSLMLLGFGGLSALMYRRRCQSRPHFTSAVEA